MDEAFIGEIFLIAFNYAPPGFALCNGQLLSISEHQLLFSLIGTTYGGNGATTFALPDLRGKVPLCVSDIPPNYTAGSTGGNIIKPLTAAHITGHTHSITTDIRMKTGTVADTASPANAYPAPATGTPRYSALADEKMMALSVDEPGGPFTTDVNVTSNFPVNNMMPSLAMNFVIALQGKYPGFDSSSGEVAIKEMQYVGDIIMTAFTKAPVGYLPCDGRTLPLGQNLVLYTILGTRYGGDGVSNFKLPDLRGKVPIGTGQGPGLLHYPHASTGGAAKVYVDASNLPAHTHTVREDRLSLPAGDNNDTHNPTGAYAGTSTTGNLYSSAAGTGTSAKLPDTLQLDNGVNAPAVDNMQPYMAISFFITKDGMFPSRS